MTPGIKFPRILSFTLMLCFLSPFANAQTPDVLEVSYQEVTTRIQSQAVDDNGNTYYAGLFKGALIVDGDTLAYGLGGEDYFLLKKNKQDSLQWVIPFGSVQTDQYLIHISWIQGNLFLHFGLPASVTFKNQIIEPLNDPSLTYATLKLDLAGNILWMKRSNFGIKEFHDIDGGSIAAISYDISEEMNPKIENETIYNLNGQKSTLIIKITRDGNFLSCYPLINTFNSNAHIGVITRSHVQNNQFYFLLSPGNLGVQTGKNELNFNGSIIPLQFPSSNSVLVKTDTSFNVKSHKILNPSGPGFYSGVTTAANRIQFSEDSTSLHLFANIGTYSLDGYNQSLNGKYGIAILDTNLNTTQFKIILENQGVINCNHIQEYKGAYYIFGTLVGKLTNTGGPPIPAIMLNIQFGNNKTILFNLNDVTRSFILKLDKNLTYINHTWIGDHTIQESNTLYIDIINFVDSSMYFYQIFDNRFNPWEIDLSLQLVKGGSKPLADQSDYIEKVKYFSNKTKLLLGLSNGLNAFDETDNVLGKASNRRDFFYAIVDSNNQIIKYNRLFSSFGTSIIRSVQTFEDSVFILLRLTSPRNQAGFNFFKIGNYAQNIPGSVHSIIIALDTLGNFSIRDMHNTPISAVWSFDIFPNGDFALMTGTTSISLNLNGQIFPNRNGFYIARSAKNGNLIQAMKIFPTTGLTSLSSNEIFVEKGTYNIITSIFGDIPPNGPDFGIISARNGNQETSITIPNPSPNSPTRKYYFIVYKASFNQNVFANALGPFSAAGVLASLTNNNHNSYISFRTGTSNDILKYKNQVLLPAESNFQSGTFSIDKDGNFLKKITFSKVPGLLAHSFLPVASKTVNNHIYVIGAQSETLHFGALKISHKGEGDGLILKLDTSLNLIQFYNVASVYSDICTDLDFFADSSLIIAYRSQGTPTASVGLNQISALNAASGILPSDLEESGYVSQLSTGMVPADYIFSIKDGSWHDASIWNTGTVPKATDRVFVRHKIQILQNTECYQVFVDPTSDLKLGEGIKLTVTGNVNN